jgi:hypothetical protein
MRKEMARGSRGTRKILLYTMSIATSMEWDAVGIICIFTLNGHLCAKLG